MALILKARGRLEEALALLGKEEMGCLELGKKTDLPSSRNSRYFVAIKLETLTLRRLESSALLRVYPGLNGAKLR